MRRREYDNNGAQSDPSNRSYFFAGQKQGEVSNNGTDNVGYATWIANRTNVDGTGAFREGATTATVSAEFDQNYTAVNGGTVEGAGGGYIVQAGDTLAGIAAQLWGDANLWYKLAEANGMSAGSALSEGQRLVVPAGVMSIHHNADTFQPYDPAKALGNVSPNTPKPPRQNKCGILGQILVAAIAIGVAAWLGPQMIGVAANAATGAAATGLTATLGTTGGAIVGGGLAAAAGSIVSQAFAVATGIQNKFSWKGVALAGVSGAIGGGLGKFNLFGEAASGALTGVANAVVRGAATNALTQGLAVVNGLSSKFDFAGVAAAGVGGGIGHEVGARIGGSEVGNFAASISAGAIANAATRSAIKGNSFGDNLIAALPDVMAQIAVRAIGTAFDGVSSPPSEGKVETIGNAYADEIVVTAGRSSESLADFFWRDASLSRSSAYRDRQAQLQKIIQSSGGSAAALVSDATIPLMTVASAGFDSVQASPDGNVLATFDYAREHGLTSEQLVEQLAANGLLGSEVRGELGISRNEFTAYNLLAKNNSIELRGVLSKLDGMARINPDAGVVKGLIEGELSRLSAVATDVVDIGIVGTFLDTAGRMVPGAGDVYGTGMDIWNGDFDPQSFLFDRLASRVGAGGLSRLGKALPSPGHGLPNVSRAAGEMSPAQVYSGGAYGRLSSQAGVIERHHTPPNSLGFTTEYSGPAIQMDYADHLLTSSHTRAGLDGKLYRAEIQDLIESGNMRGAMAKEIWDIRRAAVQGGGSANKYNAAVREMLDYTYIKGWISK